MNSLEQNRHIARLLVGAMSIDGQLCAEEQAKVAQALTELHMPELIADFGEALEEDSGDFNMFKECKLLVTSLGSQADKAAPLIFRLILEVIASDRFVSAQEASYLSAMAKRFGLPVETTREIFKQVMAERRSRLEISAKDVDEFIHPHLKEILSFDGADELVGAADEETLEDMLENAKAVITENCEYSKDDVERGLAVLGLPASASLEEAEEVWKNAINNVDLKAMADLGETFVTAALNRLAEINDAYKAVFHLHRHVMNKDKAKNEAERLEAKINRESEPSSRNALAAKVEQELTGVGVAAKD